MTKKVGFYLSRKQIFLIKLTNFYNEFFIKKEEVKDFVNKIFKKNEKI